MKKNLVFVASILIIIFFICIGLINTNKKAYKEAYKQNKEFEQYLQNEIYGTDVISLINKAISYNEKNNVPKDEKEFYINNNQNSINISLTMITDEENEETATYKMETISKVGIEEFIKNFNTAKFKCTKVEYHIQTKKISYIEFSQQYEA